MIDFFQKIITVLNLYQIPYMLSGSVAMSLYVVPRATRDFDFIINMQPEDINSFADNFKVGYYCNKDSIIDAVRQPGMFNIIDHASGFKADFIILKDNIFRREEFNRRVPIDYFGKAIFVVSPEDLLLSKLIWVQEIQSVIQFEDIKNLKMVDNLDWNYINNWVNILKLNTFDLLNN